MDRRLSGGRRTLGRGDPHRHRGHGDRLCGRGGNGDDLDLIPADTEEEAREDIEYAFAGYDTFRWLEED